MPGPFAITAASNTIRLDDKRGADTSFTVFNSSGRALRARVRVVAQNPEAQSWITLISELERDLAISATAQYSLHIAVPPTAPAGSYPFRLDVVGVDNPDDDLSEGPTVQFEVPAPVVKKASFPWWIPVAAIIALLLVAVIAYFIIQTNANNQAATSATATAIVAATRTEESVQADATAQAQATAQAVATEQAAATARALATGTAVAQVTQAAASTAAAQVTQTAVALALNDPQRFVGDWRNSAADATRLTRVSISWNGAIFRISEWDCATPETCDATKFAAAGKPVGGVVTASWSQSTSTYNEQYTVQADGRLHIDGIQVVEGIAGPVRLTYSVDLVKQP